MSGKFEIDKPSNDQFIFRLKAGNGEIILASEQYTTKSACENGIDSVRKNSTADNNFERKIAKDERHYFVLKAANHQVIGQSQMYKSADGMENGIASVAANAPTATLVDLTWKRSQ